MAEAARQPEEARERGTARVKEGTLGGHTEVAREFARRVREVTPEAEVYASWFDGVLDLWVVLVEQDPAAELTIAEIAGDLLRTYDEPPLDFMVTWREGVAHELSEMGFVRIGLTEQV